jgi:hypothetical protein
VKQPRSCLPEDWFERAGLWILAAGMVLVLVSSAGITTRVAAQSLASHPATDFHIACSLDRPVISPSGSVTVNIYTDAPDKQSLMYQWTTTTGDFSISDPSTPQRWVKKVNTSQAVWWPRDLDPGSYKISATVASPSGSSTSTQSCSVAVVVAQGTRAVQIGPESPANGTSHPTVGSYGYDTGRALLVQGQPQRTGFGLYSYMLLGAPPDQEAKQRFLNFIIAYLNLIADIKGLESSQSKTALNITYLPVTSDPPDNVSPSWVLDHYDYGRARMILRSVPSARGRGPFIISALQPLDGSSGLPTPNLVEDLTDKPVGVVEFWVNQFLVQTTQQQFWQANTLRSVALNLRTAIAYAAEGFPMVQKAIPDSIVFNSAR